MAADTSKLGIEPRAAQMIVDGLSIDSAMKLSIAISLKRLADQLAGTPERLGAVDALYDINGK